MKLSLSIRAQGDLRDIWAYTEARWGEKQVDLYADRLWKAMESIGRNPKIGKTRPAFPDDILTLKTGRHFICYRVEKDKIVIDCVLHECMDFSRNMG